MTDDRDSPIPDNPAQLQVVLFDVGGVLSPPPDPAAVAAIERALSIDRGLLSPLLYDGDPWHALSVGAMEEEVYWQILAERTMRDPLTLRELVRPVWGPEGGGGVDAGVVDLVRFLRARVRVAILSNATTRLEDFLQRHQVSQLFDPILNSARIGFRKPDPRAYTCAIAQLGVPPGSVLFVDDKPRNTRIARELGIPSIDFTSAADLAPALRALTGCWIAERTL